MKTTKTEIAAWILGITAAVLLMELFSIHPHYENEPATVRKVLPNPRWKFIGEDEMTSVRFDDGYTTEIAGNKGEPGDRILVSRQRGTDTLLGLFATKEALK